MSLIVAAVVMTGIVTLALKSRTSYLQLPELDATSPISETSEDHVVIIPARNEEARIARAVRSLEGSLVLVVDDYSADSTAEVALEAGAHVRPAEPLPPGAKGKPNACWTGALFTDSKWILFVDAGTWYESGFVSRLLDYAVREDLIAVSVFPERRSDLLLERALCPYALGLHFTGVNPRAVRDPKAAAVLANGQCLLVRRDAYEFVKGHRAVARSLVEDVALVALFKRHRMKVHVLRAGKLAHASGYESFGQIRSGLARSASRFFRSARSTPFWVVGSCFVMACWLPALLWLIWAGHVTAACLFALVPSLAWWPWYGSPWRAMLAPLAIYLFPWITLTGLVKHLFGITMDWRGRRV
jgi:chlorobactene glucosyltransferase